MDAFAIGVPLPPRGTNSKYPFGELPVGGSFFVAGEVDRLRKLQNTISRCAMSYGRRHSMAFATRIVRGESGCGVGVWRTA